MEPELVGIARSVKGKEEPNCTKCVHHTLHPPDSVLLYSSPKHHCTAAIDLVTGDTIVTDCYAMRHPRCECGPDAKLFKDAPANGGNTKPDSPPNGERRIGLKAFLFGLGVLVILALVFWGYEQQTDRPRIIQTGEVSQMREVSVKDGSCCVTARTRLLATGKRSSWQFEASPGEWKDCGDDCEKALRRALAK